MSTAAFISGRSATKARAKRTAKETPDRRLHLSTVRMLVAAAIVTAFLFMIGFVTAWGERMDRLAEVSASDVFSGRSYTTIDGGQYTPEDLKNARLTLFNVWSTTCPPCIGELPELEELGHSYAPGEVQVIGVLSDSIDSEGVIKEDHIKEANDIIAKAGATFPTIVMDRDLYAFVASTIVGTPTTYFVDSEGNTIKMDTGSQKLEGWKAAVDEVLAELS